MLDPHLDDTALGVLKDIMLDGFPTLVATFSADATQRLQALHRQFEAGNAEAFRRTAHSFKGSSSNMAALRLAALCNQLELLAREGQLDGVPPLLEAVEREFLLVRGLLDGHCGHGGEGAASKPR